MSHDAPADPQTPTFLPYEDDDGQQIDPSSMLDQHPEAVEVIRAFFVPGDPPFVISTARVSARACAKEPPAVLLSQALGSVILAAASTLADMARAADPNADVSSLVDDLVKRALGCAATNLEAAGLIDTAVGEDDPN